MSINGKEGNKNVNNIMHLRVVNGTVPSNENGKVKNQPPRRVKNSERRDREYLTLDEVERLIVGAKKRGRQGQRDGALILIAFRHGLRVSELVALKWSEVDFDNQQLHVTRLKNGKPSVHPLPGDEMRVLRKLHTQADGSAFVFTSERGGPLDARTVRHVVAEAGKVAGIPFAHPHQLRHACGFKLANDGRDTRLIQGYLGHKSITHTVHYTELSPHRFNDLWGAW